MLPVEHEQILEEKVVWDVDFNDCEVALNNEVLKLKNGKLKILPWLGELNKLEYEHRDIC